MNKFLKFFSICLFILIGFSSINAQDSTCYVGFTKGRIYAGINTQVSGTQLSELAFSPSIGYSICNKGLVYGYLNVREKDDYQDYKIGYNHMIYKSLYAGLGFKYTKENNNEYKFGSGELGFIKEITSYLLVSPKVELNYELGDTNDFMIVSSICMMLKL